MRLKKEDYYLEIARSVCRRGTCLRRRFGSVIVSRDQIVSTGYVGAPRGAENCCDRGVCERNRLNVPSGERYELCRSVHSEANAIIHASRDQMIGSTLYLYGENADGSIAVARPCQMCRRLILNAGISRVVIRTPEGFAVEDVEDYTRDNVSREWY